MHNQDAGFVPGRRVQAARGMAAGPSAAALPGTYAAVTKRRSVTTACLHVDDLSVL
jgi:hypothetical protein